jgi:hypothetical protein
MKWLLKLSNVAVDRMPKRISPSTHAMIDYGFAALTLLYAIKCLRHNKAAAMAGFVAAAAELTNVLMTDIPGGAIKQISFPLHGRIDMGNTAMLAAMPGFMGFGGEPESRFFYGSAATIQLLTSLTDFTGTGETAQSETILAARH